MTKLNADRTEEERNNHVRCDSRSFALRDRPS